MNVHVNVKINDLKNIFVYESLVYWIEQLEHPDGKDGLFRNHMHNLQGKKLEKVIRVLLKYC